METDLHTYRYRVSLRLRHPTEPLTYFADALGLAPDFQHVVGESRRSRNGEPLPGQYKESYWCHALDVPESQDVEAFLLTTVERLDAHSILLSQLITSGGSAELFIGFFLESFNSGFSLSPELLRKCVALGIALDFDVYGHEPVPEPAA
ncbi:DUF4279 domain-containing protein [Lysobacter sp. CFH 32150]|uniref:DUF4279 domain-containing protein n=1 Tax=Lysobacter sp. CFH 32150 TaxID=2927128 RepID=UPI001FA73DE1|nr:DUF4279 domain-containing protein [Lysobacter sp. CFH 32150]